MNVVFNHYRGEQIGEILVKVPTPTDCLYRHMCQMLEFDDDSALSNFINEGDSIISFRDKNEYNGNVVISYKRFNDEPRALFCYDIDNPITGKQFYEALCSQIKHVYVEEFI